MAKRCTNKGFYVQGVKIYSAAATYDSDKGPLKVIVSGEPGLGEISVKDLPDGATLRFTDHQDMRLQYIRETMHGRRGRELFDPYKVPQEHRDAYISLALSSMAMGASESEYYADIVMKAAISFPGKKVSETLVARCDTFLNPGSQQYNEVQGAKLLASVVGLSFQEQEVSPQWLQAKLDSITHWHGLALLLTPGTLPEAADDFLLNKVLAKIKEQNPTAMSEFATSETRSEADRATLRSTLVKYMAARPTIENLMDMGNGSERHANFFAQILVQAQQTTPARHGDDALAVAKQEVLALVATNSIVVVPSPPAAKKVNAVKKQKRERLTLKELVVSQLELNTELCELQESQGAAEKQGNSKQVESIARNIAAVNKRLAGVTGSITNIWERRYSKAESYTYYDKKFDTPREKGQAPVVPSLVAGALTEIKKNCITAVMDTLLGVAPDPGLTYPVKRTAAEIAEHRLALACALYNESKVARTPDENGLRPSLFDYTNGPGISPYRDVPWGGLWDPEAVKSVNKTQKNEKLDSDPLFVRARLMHSALFPADDRLITDISALVLGGNNTPKTSGLNQNSAKTCIENFEQALYTFVSLSAIWEGALAEDKSITKELTINFEDERSLMLTESTRKLLGQMRKGTLRPGNDPVRTSFNCLAALQEVGWVWPNLVRQVREALADPVVRKSREKTKEYQTSLPEELPKDMLKYLRNLSKPDRRGQGARRTQATKAGNKPSRT